MKFVLSGGGVRGFAHVGVLQALREHGITPTAISSTSAGSIVGAFIADGFSPEEIRELLLKHIGLGMLFQWDALGSGVITLKKFGDFMRKNLRHNNLEDLPMPLFIAATNFVDGSQQIFSTGNIVDRVLAACSIPGIFPPAVIDKTPYVDGGLYNNLPVEPFQDCRQDVIAVYVNPIPPYSDKSSMIQTLDRTFHLSFMHTVKRSAEGCKLFIEPGNLHSVGMFEVHKLKEVYETGYTFTKQMLQGNNQAHPSP